MNLRESKNIEEFVLLSEMMPQKVWSSFPDGQNDYVNSRFLEYTGLTIEQMTGFGWQSIIHEEDLPDAIARWNHSMRTGDTFEMEYRLRDSQGNFFWHLGRSIPLRDADNQVTKWIGTATDIHANKQLEQQIKEKAQEFEFLVDSIPHIVWKANSKGEVVFYNKRWFEFTGIGSREGAEGKWKGVPHPDDQERTIKAWEESIRTGNRYKIEHRIRSADGSYRWLMSHALPFKDRDGSIMMWFGTATDIHDEKTYLEELEWMQKQMQEKNQELIRVNVDLDNFVYTASHDLRTPILNIAGLHALLMEQLKDKAGAREKKILDMMNHSVKRLELTIRDLSEIAKLQKENEQRELLLFSKIYDEILKDLESLAHQSGVELLTDFRVSEIRYPPRHLRSIMYNLLSNAIKYASPERSPRVKVSTYREEGAICLQVEDNGLGMDSRQQGKLFKMFTRMHTHVDGTGIGLYMIKRIVENNQGSIKVSSKEGQGSIFTVCFDR
jgi:PAS domain S-box-containing protein